ncbi:hypothetical protein [Pseudomonas luteola]|uniref:hypothetical protein n=1 Tax=Pseudomonas luteola TaxID=47886 RepID=UPI001239303E|nr:hypothetical protein [Pseudomonas luteola]QEU29349.1 hypothetical protein FOB45_16905 [Pseudomonas luteola]
MSAYLDDNEQSIVRTAAKALGINIVDDNTGRVNPNFIQLSASAEAHKSHNGSLADWTPSIKKGSAVQLIYRDANKEIARVRREAFKAAKETGYDPKRATALEVAAVVRAALEQASSNHRPTGKSIIREVARQRQHGEDWVMAVAKKPSKRLVRKALDDHEDHPVMQSIRSHDMLKANDKKDIANANLSATVDHLYRRYDIAAKLSRLEREVQKANALAEQANKRAEQAHARLDIVEVGKHWHEVAVEMRAAGASYGAIAAATGQSRSTVSSFIKRQESKEG